MKRVICDECRKEAEPDTYGMAPKGWYAVTKRGVYDESANQDFCSTKCVVDSTLRALEAEKKAASLASATQEGDNGGVPRDMCGAV